MGDLSDNFKRSEFACRCGCGLSVVDAELIRVLEDARAHFTTLYGAIYCTITSGNRCKAHNKKEGGAPTSQHRFCKAADHRFVIVSDGNIISPEETYNYYHSKYTDKYGVGLYSNRVHIDVRSSGKARWKQKRIK
jgi:uncharacterized protein YcbK (DUF882 family)